MKLVIVDFLDHCHTYSGSTPPIPCRAVGWIVEETETHLVIASWIADNQIKGQNTDTYTILKHKGMKIRRLRVK